MQIIDYPAFVFNSSAEAQAFADKLEINEGESLRVVADPLTGKRFIVELLFNDIHSMYI